MFHLVAGLGGACAAQYPACARFKHRIWIEVDSGVHLQQLPGHAMARFQHGHVATSAAVSSAIAQKARDSGVFMLRVTLDMSSSFPFPVTTKTKA